MASDKICRNCFLWSPLHYEKILDESVCGKTVDTVTTGDHTCKDWRKDILEHMR